MFFNKVTAKIKTLTTDMNYPNPSSGVPAVLALPKFLVHKALSICKLEVSMLQ